MDDTATPHAGDWLTGLLGRFDPAWLLAPDGLPSDLATRSGLRRISAAAAADQIGRLLELYRGERDKLVAVARQRLGSFADDAEDVVQEVMRKLCERPPALRDPTKLTSYVYSALYNETSTWGGRAAKDRLRRAPATDDTDVIVRDVVADPASGFDDVIVFHMIISRALATLSPRERQLVELVDIARLTEREAAAKMGITIGTAKSYHHAARSRLRDNPDLANLRNAA